MEVTKNTLFFQIDIVECYKQSDPKLSEINGKTPVNSRRLQIRLIMCNTNQLVSRHKKEEQKQVR